MKKVKMLILVIIAVLAITLTGCGGTEPASQQLSTPAPASEQPSTPAPTAQPTPTAEVEPAKVIKSEPEEELEPVEDAETEEEPAASDEEVSDELQKIADQIITATMGITEAGETIYYGEAEDFGVLLFYDDSINQYMSYVGPVTQEETYITVTDEEKGLSFTFEIKESEEGVYLIDTGDSGEAIMAECEPIDLVKALDEITINAAAADAGLSELADAITFAGIGVTEEEQTIYYAEAGEEAILVFHNEPTNEYAAFVGPATIEENAITIIDNERGMTFTFTLEETEDGAVVIDTGDFGMAAIVECEPLLVINVLNEVTVAAESVN